ncbi:hypothetical protein U2F26_32590 [Micromonospora sp. 4G57]|uniref:Uncharacterized protein n=1 Tax=Micromonospora sicca TaxID=2202420 RepID=A0ABU5JNB5_9ACTN|nr:MULTISPECIES: hypothetical protein [unclassified Micromonospora]MDZ5447392.1 hypothetical protein [Micromonospora sp. 4G57]MDZ5494112.1 hypothetical protein [Micromonospora sp. 4G53]
MGTLDVAFAVGTGVVAGLNVAVGVAMLVRSRHQPGAIRWRGQWLVAPRLAACAYLCLGLFFAIMALSDVLFERGSKGDDLMFLVGMVFAAATIVTGVMWLHRRSRTAPAAER